MAGMHRSGTSLVARLLAETGMDLPRDLMPPHPVDNPEGYFESQDVLNINNAFLKSLGQTWRSATPLPGGCFDGSDAAQSRTEIDGFLERCGASAQCLLLKDPRFCRLMPLWLPVLRDHVDGPLALVHVVRRAHDVGRSLARRAEAPDIARAAITSEDHAALLWLHYNLEMHRHAAGLGCVVVRLEELQANPRTGTRRLLDDLGAAMGKPLTLSASSIDARRERSVPLASERDRVLEAVYAAIGAGDGAAFLDRVWHRLCVTVPQAGQAEGDSVTEDVAVLQAARLRHVTSQVEYSATRSVPVKSARTRILFVSGRPESKGHLYRVGNGADGLCRQGVDAPWVGVDTFADADVRGLDADAVVIYRAGLNAATERLLDQCKRRGTPVGVDVDDLVFDPDLIANGGVDFVSRLPASAQDQWIADAAAIRSLMGAVDFCVVPTPTLADHARRVCPETVVIENGFSPETRAVSDHWRLGRTPGAGIRVGYASGSATHQADFATVVDALGEVLRRHPDWSCTVVGALDLAEFADELPAGQVERRRGVEHVNLAYELARFDINIVPLQTPNAFCDAKSPLKYFEAALVGTPSVVVDNPVYADIVRPGANGYLATTNDEWIAALETLGRDPEARARQASLARDDSIARFNADRLAEKYLELLH